jgi:hypothetical protein
MDGTQMKWLFLAIVVILVIAARRAVRKLYAHILDWLEEIKKGE